MIKRLRQIYKSHDSTLKEHTSFDSPNKYAVGKFSKIKKLIPVISLAFSFYPIMPPILGLSFREETQGKPRL